MTETLHDALQPVLVRWTMGGAAAQLAPDGMREKLGDDPEEAELRLLALAGQALGLLAAPEPSGALTDSPDLPVLALPTVPDALRPLAARVLARNEEWLRLSFLRLLEARGVVAHPSDWMPTRAAQVPAVYAPWQDWLGGTAGATSETDADPTRRWDDLGPAGRRALVASLRAADSEAGLALVRDKLSGQPADQRLWMVEALSTGLAARDRSFLEGLSGDRAPTVRAAAGRLLKRMGVETHPASDDQSRDAAADVADFLVVETRGLIVKRRSIALMPPRNMSQVSRRAAMMDALDPARLAGALDVRDAELPGMWPWGRDAAFDARFARMVLDDGTDEVVAALERAIAEGASVAMADLGDGIRRLSAASASRLASRAYAEARSLAQAASTSPVAGMVDEYQASPAWRAVRSEIQREGGVQAAVGTLDLLALGVLVTARAAREIVAKLNMDGMPYADPRLDALRVNAGL